MIKEGYPALYEKIKARVKEGRLEPQGALWVECDTNVTGSESLVRQILYGRCFFQDEFGVDPHYVWMVEPFSNSAALPGILKRDGNRPLHVLSTETLHLPP